MNWLLAIGLASLPLLLGEALYKKAGLKRELARKTVHILGAFASVGLLWFLDLSQIIFLGLSFVIVLAVVRRKRLVGALYDVNRTSLGEILFPAGVASTALVANSNPAYAFGIMVMGLADAAAGIFGTKYGHKRYKPWFGTGKKSYVGSLAFCAVTLIVGGLFLVAYFDPTLTNGAKLLAASLILTLIESQLSYGTDNLVIPVIATALLQGTVT
ncbi:MAG TPA: hypothetical protein VK674_03550 [Candidatus Limnocylindria bacterium]|nr:hypothetical protein [Candidatus Limnocylindria bacterium]